MDKEIKDKWIRSLRSGKYKQGRICLYRPKLKTYCCLGVLLKEIIYIEKDTYPSICSKVDYDAVSKILNEDSNKKDISIQLIHKNDSDVSFNDIADWIENNL